MYWRGSAWCSSWVEHGVAVPARRAQGRFIVGAGLAVFLETSLAGAECVAVALRCGKLLDSLRSIPACHGLGIARACVEDHFPEPERFGRITALFSQDGEVSQGQMAVDTLIDATELVGSLSALATFPTFTGH